MLSAPDVVEWCGEVQTGPSLQDRSDLGSGNSTETQGCTAGTRTGSAIDFQRGQKQLMDAFAPRCCLCPALLPAWLLMSPHIKESEITFPVISTTFCRHRALSSFYQFITTNRPS